VLAFAGAVLLATGRGYTAFARYVMPIIPVACVLAGQAVAALGRVRPLPRRALPLLVAVVAAPSIATSVWLDVLLAAPTRASPPQNGSPRSCPARRPCTKAVRVRPDGHSLPGFHGGITIPHRALRRSRAGRASDWLILHRSPLNAYTSVPPAIEALAAGRYTRIRVFAATRGDANPATMTAGRLLPSACRLAGRPEARPTITVYARAISVSWAAEP